MSKYHKTEGGLWPNDDKSKPSHPDSKGRIEVSPEQMKGLIAMAKEGKPQDCKSPRGIARRKILGRSTSMSPLRFFGMPKHKRLLHLHLHLPRLNLR